MRLSSAAFAGALVSSLLTVGVVSAPSASAAVSDCNGDQLNTPPALINNYALIYSGTPIRSGASASCGTRRTTSGTQNFRLRCWVKNAAGNYWYYGTKTGANSISGWVYDGNIVPTSLPNRPRRAAWRC